MNEPFRLGWDEALVILTIGFVCFVALLTLLD